MGRKILFITTDQQRFDSLGCNGNSFCRTPNIDALARDGHQLRARLQSEHGLHAGALDDADGAICAHAWRICQRRAAAGRRAERRAISEGQSRLQDRADRQGAFRAGVRSASEMAREPPRRWKAISARGAASTTRSTRCTSRAFSGRPVGHYGRWMQKNHPEFFNALAAASERRRRAAIPARRRRRTIPCRAGSITPTGSPASRSTGSNGLDADDDWFLWLSFPDPHHPWDPPASENTRCDWRDLPLPDGYPGTPEKIRKVLAQQAGALARLLRRHVRQYRRRPDELHAAAALPRQHPRDQRQGSCDERADRRSGRPRDGARSKARGWDDDTDVIFTTDHGELQGDFGFVYKGPFHVDALMRLPFIWRPAPNANVAPAIVAAAGGAGRSRADLLRHRRRRAGAVDAGQGAADVATMARASARSANGTASFPATASICARSIATALCSRATSRRRRAAERAGRNLAAIRRRRHAHPL